MTIIIVIVTILVVSVQMCWHGLVPCVTLTPSMYVSSMVLGDETEGKKALGLPPWNAITLPHTVGTDNHN